MPSSSVAERIADRLAAYLGEFNARIAVRTFTKKTFDLAVEDLTAEHVPQLLEALRPMLNTLAGRATAESLLQQIRQEVV